LQFVGDIGAGTLPVGVTANFDGKHLYVLNQSSENISAYGIDSVTGQLASLPRSPFAGAGSSNSIVADALGERLYAGDLTAIIGYRSFDNRGSLGMLPRSPFDGVSGAYGLSVDLSERFLYAANNTGDTVSGFQVDRTSGALPSYRILLTRRAQVLLPLRSWTIVSRPAQQLLSFASELRDWSNILRAIRVSATLPREAPEVFAMRPAAACAQNV
jgi:DNA-binding beta-propeller fold protein YncE